MNDLLKHCLHALCPLFIWIHSKKKTGYVLLVKKTHVLCFIKRMRPLSEPGGNTVLTFSVTDKKGFSG